GDYAQAEPLYRQALEIRRAVLGEQHLDFTETLHNLASLYDATGDYAQAERLYRQVIEIRRTISGEQHPGLAVSLNNLALLYKTRGDYAQAEPFYRQATEIRRMALGEQHPEFAQSLSNLASLCAATDRPQEAIRLLTQTVAINDQTIGQMFSIGSESQRMVYLYQQSGYTNFFFSLITQYQADQSEAIQRGLDFLLRRKALGAEGLAVQRDAVLSGRYPELAAQFRQLSHLRQQIASKTLAGPGPEGLPAHQQQLTDWHSQQKTLEANLAGQIPEMNLTQKLQAINLQTVAQALPKASILVEFVRFDIVDFKAIPTQGDMQLQPARYLAFVLPAGEPDNVSMVDLGEAEPMDHLIVAYRATITGETDHRGLFYGDEDATEQVSDLELGQKLHAVIFDPLLPTLGDCRRLFLSPDGDLSRLPFEILPTDDGHRLIDDFQISYVNAGRDVLRFGAKHTGEPTEPVVVADPDFDLAVEGANVEAILEQGAAAGGRRSKDLNRAGLHFGPLPGTRSEGEKIAEMLNAVTLFGPEAVESRFKQIRSPRILHIATHGFFLPDQPSEVSPDSLNTDISAQSLGRLEASLENPLLRSGLALAGANTWLKGGPLPAEAEDALFHGEDVTALDLLATELVVLSACETG
ncbi:MAG: tetratricopeptide repeat protein, partial [Anaerolineae bacterium]|nr:tetratricopeptide repeat protein [Anaerolineae bacterium]